MDLKTGQTLAALWLERLQPYCSRIEIAGSIRRRKPVVTDIELVAVPKLSQERDLFGAIGATHNLLEMELCTLDETVHFAKAGPRYKQITFPDGDQVRKLDLFIVLLPAQWGVIFTIRTGPADFSRRLVTKKRHCGLLPSYMQVKDGALWAHGKVIETPEEKDFFRAIGLERIEPWERK